MATSAAVTLALSDENAKNNLPSTPRPEYVAAAPDVQLIRDLLGGTRVMHAKYRLYMPKYKSEPGDRYKIRAQSSSVYGALGRSLSASVGMLFAKPPQLQDNWTAEMEEEWENIDARGTHGNVFSKRAAQDAIADGFVGILVDFPQAPTEVAVTSANEKTLNLRPRWAPYQRSDVLSWRTEILNNVETLTQVVLREGKAQSVGRFGVVPVIQYRVCSLGTVKSEDGETAFGAFWELLEERKDDTGSITIVVVASGVFRDNSGALFEEIPFAVPYAGRSDSTLTADPPLLDLAWANLQYWQIASELRWYEKLAAHPQATLEGELAGSGQISADGQVLKPQLQIGPTTLIQTVAGGKFTWTEVSGKSFDGLRASLDATKADMSELGASFLRKVNRGVETAEAKRLDATAENSTLATAAQGIEDGLNEALRFHAKYLGIEAEQAPTLAINRDFEALTMDAPTMLAYVALVNAGFPKRLVLESLQIGGRIQEDEDLDALELKWEAGLIAEQDQQRLLAEAKAASGQSGDGAQA